MSFDRMRLGTACLALGASLALAVPAVAAEATEAEGLSPERQGEYNASRKLGRGLAGIVYGVLEVPGNMVQEGRVHGPLYGATVGLILGTAKMVARIPVGVFETVTAPFEMPPGYEPILEPEYPWLYFRAEEGELYGLRNTYLADEEKAIAAIPGSVVERRRGALVVQFPSELLFPFGSAELSPEARQRLDELATVLSGNPEARLFVKGFTDTIGPDAYNFALSDERARVVRAHLASRGIAANRIDIGGFGPALPVASNDTPEGRRFNRRVEIEVRAGEVAAP
jgi:putative exosortase-associated protein (TIGR04073 family)